MQHKLPDDQLAEIKDECLELTNAIETSILKIDAQNTPDLVDEVFRHFHNIKSIAGFIEFWNVSKIAGEGEKILDIHRKKKILLNKDSASVLKEAAEIIKKLITSSDGQNNNTVEDYKNRISEYLELLNQLSHTDSAAKTKKLDEVDSLKSKESSENEGKNLSFLKSSIKSQQGEDYLKNIEIIFEEVSVEMKQFSSGSFKRRDLQILQEAFASMHHLSVKIGYTKMAKSCEVLDKFFKVYSKDILAIPYEFVNKSRELIDYVFGLTFLKKNSLPENLLKRQEQSLKKFSNDFEKIVENRKNEIFKLVEDTSSFTFRIAVDDMLKIVSSTDELSVNIKNLKANHVKHGTTLDENDQFSIDELSKIENSFLKMQDLINKATKIPLKQLFYRFVRVVQNSAELVNKKINFNMEGEHIEIDQFYLNPLNVSIIHILRNACDHGIETPEERIAAGKNPVGAIDMIASLDKGKLVILVKDDGKGLSRDKITEKLLENNWYQPEEIKAMDDSTLFRQIFKPGFSTADEVTEISGRGVGMDVVNKEMEKINGKIEIQSKPNSGLAITIILPAKPVIKNN